MADDTRRLRTLSLFSGIGGIDLGLKRWCKTVVYCEIDPYACGVLIKNMAKGTLDVAPIWSDIKTFGQSEIDQVGSIECVTGGFPCQDISLAGDGAGITGETRSGLFFELARIVRLVRPRIVFVENVPAITGRGLSSVLQAYAEIGYNAEWITLAASDVGAPHRRARWWLLAYPNQFRSDAGPESAGWQERTDFSRSGKGTIMADTECLGRQQGSGQPEQGRQRGTQPISGGKALPDANSQGLQERKSKNTSGKGKNQWPIVSGSEWWAVEPDVGRVVDGIPFRVHRVKCIGNAVVPQCAKKAFEILTGNLCLLS